MDFCSIWIEWTRSIVFSVFTLSPRRKCGLFFCYSVLFQIFSQKSGARDNERQDMLVRLYLTKDRVTSPPSPGPIILCLIWSGTDIFYSQLEGLQTITRARICWQDHANMKLTLLAVTYKTKIKKLFKELNLCRDLIKHRAIRNTLKWSIHSLDVRVNLINFIRNGVQGKCFNL